MRPHPLPRLCLLVLGCVVLAGTARAQDGGRKQTVEFVVKLQTESGGFLPQAAKGGKKAQPTLRATSSAMRAVHYFGGKLPRAEAVAKFVESCHDAETGGYADSPKGTPDVFVTAS